MGDGWKRTGCSPTTVRSTECYGVASRITISLLSLPSSHRGWFLPPLLEHVTLYTVLGVLKLWWVVVVVKNVLPRGISFTGGQSSWPPTTRAARLHQTSVLYGVPVRSTPYRYIVVFLRALHFALPICKKGPLNAVVCSTPGVDPCEIRSLHLVTPDTQQATAFRLQLGSSLEQWRSLLFLYVGRSYTK
jgi:hypothetical protein